MERDEPQHEDGPCARCHMQNVPCAGYKGSACLRCNKLRQKCELFYNPKEHPAPTAPIKGPPGCPPGLRSIDDSPRTWPDVKARDREKAKRAQEAKRNKRGTPSAQAHKGPAHAPVAHATRPLFEQGTSGAQTIEAASSVPPDTSLIQDAPASTTDGATKSAFKQARDKKQLEEKKRGT